MPAHALAQAPQTWRRCHPTQEQPLRRRQTLTSRIRRQIGQPPAAASTHRPPNARGKASKRQEGGPPPRPDAPARGPSISPGARQRRHHGSSRRQRNTIERRARARRSLQMAGRGGGGGPPPPTPWGDHRPVAQGSADAVTSTAVAGDAALEGTAAEPDATPRRRASLPPPQDPATGQ